MNTLMTLLMQKAQRLVIKSTFILLLFYFQTISSQQNDMRSIIEQTIENFKYKKDSMVCSMKSIDITNMKSELKHYYDFRTKNRPFYTFFAIDSTTGEDYIDSIPSEISIKYWKKKYRALDSLFTAKEIKQIIDVELSESKDYVFNSKQQTVEWCKDCECTNRLSKPFFNSNRDVVLILHRINITYISNHNIAYIYRKSDGEWLLYSTINTFGGGL